MVEHHGAPKILAIPVIPFATEIEVESTITRDIARLWSAHRDQAAKARKTRDELKVLKASLAERLHQMKALLVQSGRGGRWTSYLREHRIPRATADRYVQQHESTLAPSGEKRLTEAIPLSTEDVVRTFFDKMLPRLRRALPNQEAIFLFVCELVIGLPGVKGDVTDEGAVIFRPEEQNSTPVVQNSLPQALHVVA